MNKQVPNVAGVTENIDNTLMEELKAAGIPYNTLPEMCRGTGEVKTIIVGELHMWTFQRAWSYWVAKGPGIPLNYANNLHRYFGDEVRVDGHCMCPSPYKQFKGFGVGHYHVDTAEGLRALAKTIIVVINEATPIRVDIPGNM